MSSRQGGHSGTCENDLLTAFLHGGPERATKGKGCDLGYALAASSCEEADSVEACTVTAPDAITAFAVPNPDSSSQSQPVFSGLVAPQVALLS
jgi:hypothetical protein